ncbi:MAG: sigma 54-interacting transcriptional regulator [Myxococcales bacterium]|nr:sigma 54-interacting transcriptional regulator [Myxococcales bacterium]
MTATRIITDASGRTRRSVARYRLRHGDDERVVGAARFRIGSEQGNDLVLDARGVSRYHAEIVADERGFVVRDLGSTNGTFVGGLRVEGAYLPSGSTRLRLGGCELSVELLEQQQHELETSDAEELAGMVGTSPLMREIFATIERVAPSGATVLVQGESGTGKELVASALHGLSQRSGSLCVFDCAAVPSSLVEAQLFGHERGAFTGASDARAGVFEEADGGTLFLDELGELPLELQPKLLRALETRSVTRIGATRARQVDVRLVAATNRDLAREVNRGSFRADLYYRLAVVELAVPPLRDRREDVRPLAIRFIKDALRHEPGRAAEVIAGVSEDNWQRLEKLPWPGNVRELRNFIERTLVLSDGPRTQDIAVAARRPTPGAPASSSGANAALDLDKPFSDHKADVITDFERAYLFGQLERHDNNISAAARASGLDRMNFKRILKKYR